MERVLDGEKLLQRSCMERAWCGWSGCGKGTGYIL